MALDWAVFRPADALAGEQPSCTSSDYSPSTELFSYPDAFSKANPMDSCTGQPDYLLDDWMSHDIFDRPLSSVEATGFSAKNPGIFNSNPSMAVPNLNTWRRTNSAPFGNTLPNLNENMFVSGMPFSTMNHGSLDSSCASPRDSSPTPSLCGDGSQLGLEPRPASPASSDASLKRHSPTDSTDQDSPAPKRVQRKRGRPRLNRSGTDDCPTTTITTNTNINNINNTNNSADSTATTKSRTTRRLPHNQVERKYREGLNSELERLRRAVPTLPQREGGDLNSPPKPSKATVLASAIDYIKFIEAERERLTEENKRLREGRGGRGSNAAGGPRSSAKLRGYGWSKGRSNSSGSFALGG
ncbi:hypothetical protein V2W45_13254 [Cenococcum geophilum]